MAIFSTSLAYAAPAHTPAKNEGVGVIVVISPKGVAPTISEMKAKWNNPGAETLYRNIFSTPVNATPPYTETSEEEHDFMKCINHDAKLNTPTSCDKPQAFVGKDAPDVIATKILAEGSRPSMGGDEISINANINLLSVQEYSTPDKEQSVQLPVITHVRLSQLFIPKPNSVIQIPFHPQGETGVSFGTSYLYVGVLKTKDLKAVSNPPHG